VGGGWRLCSVTHARSRYRTPRVHHRRRPAVRAEGAGTRTIKASALLTGVWLKYITSVGCGHTVYVWGPTGLLLPRSVCSSTETKRKRAYVQVCCRCYYCWCWRLFWCSRLCCEAYSKAWCKWRAHTCHVQGRMRISLFGVAANLLNFSWQRSAWPAPPCPTSPRPTPAPRPCPPCSRGEQKMTPAPRCVNQPRARYRYDARQPTASTVQRATCNTAHKSTSAVCLPLGCRPQSSTRPGRCLIHLNHPGWRPASPEGPPLRQLNTQRTKLQTMTAAL
jgi:hypothetical protein